MEKNRKQFRQWGSSYVIKIRQDTYDFLFDFQSNYMPISFRYMIVRCAVTPPPIGERSIVISVSVCVCVLVCLRSGGGVCGLWLSCSRHVYRTVGGGSLSSRPSMPLEETQSAGDIASRDDVIKTVSGSGSLHKAHSDACLGGTRTRERRRSPTTSGTGTCSVIVELMLNFNYA